LKQADAAQVLLLRAVETVPHPAWSADDGRWASRVARDEAGAGAPAGEFLLARARAAWQRLGPREPALARWLGWAQPRAGGLGGAVAIAALALAAFAAGVAIDHVGSAQRIDLLAPPVWGVLLWNLAVYAVIAVHALLPGGRPRRLPRAWAALTLPRLARAGDAAAVPARFAAELAALRAPRAAFQGAAALHLAAAALALGLIAGLYLRGLVLDYRAGWQSTFLDARQVHALLGAALAPASRASGIALPDLAAVQALQLPAGGAAVAPAAMWIHLYAWQLGLLVLLPRLALALLAGWRARRLAAHAELPLAEPYFARLLAQRAGRVPRLLLCPYAHRPDPQAVERLRAALAAALGDASDLQAAPAVPHGAEDDAPLPPADGRTRLALFALGATPEAENHGRFLRRLAQTGTVLALVDEAAFRARFGDDAPRLAARRQAWQALAATSGADAAFIDLRAPDVQGFADALAGGGRELLA